MTSPEPAQLSESEIKERLTRALGGQYEVRSLLGRGGFAEVYEVWDKSLDRRLAVKVLRPDIAWTPGMLTRFRQEAKAVAQLAHPNILPIHFVGEGEGIVYYAMPFIEGQSLGDMIRTKGRLDPDQALSIAKPIFEALEHAHQKGLVHRDIKPDNIMIDKASGRPLLVDFGIAKQMEAGKPGKGLTQTGFVVGTPHYMSPEQALGQADLDARSDIYAMGAVLYQMVTGTPPFDGETSQDIVAQHITQPPPLATAVDAKVPRWLSDVIVRCLAKKPADRFSTASLAIRALSAGRKSGSQEPVSADRVVRAVEEDRTTVIPPTQRDFPKAPNAAPYTPPEPAGVKRGRSSVGLMVILGVVLLGAAAGAVWFIGQRSLVVENRLVESIQLVEGSGERRTVDPGSEAAVKLSGASAGGVRWVLIRPTTPQGVAMGLEMNGTVDAGEGRGTTRRAVDGSAMIPAAFAPLITNATDRPLSITINAGLAGAQGCECLIPAGANRARIGYYQLYRNSTVRAEDQSGRSASFTDLGDKVDPSNGTVGLRFEEKDFSGSNR
jgi:serine/threonine-protein kinase